MRRACWAGAVVFALFAAVQLDDPDPARWIAVYGLTAGYSVVAALGRLPRGPIALWAGLLGISGVVELLSTAGDDPMGAAWMGPLASESVREGLGLMLAAAWSGFLGWLGPAPRME